MEHIHLNGSIVRGGEAFDNAAFRYGYGIFETMLVQDGAIRLWPYHAERLVHGAEVIGLWHPTAQELHDAVLVLAEKNGMSAHCRVRLQLYGGSGHYGADDNGGHIITCHTPPVDGGAITVGIADGVAKATDMLANLKTTSALLYAVAAAQARARNWDDALVLNTAGNIAESTTANIFWIEDGNIFTPPLTEGCVAGVMRRYLLDEMPEIQQEPLPPARLAQADEVFLTNALRIRSVARLGDKTYGTSKTSGIKASALMGL